MTQPQSAKAPEAAPGLPGRVTFDGTDLTSPAAVYQATVAQKTILVDQLSELESSRRGLAQEIKNNPQAADRAGVTQRITSVDARIADLDKQIAQADAQMARAASIPGAIVDSRTVMRTGVPEEVPILAIIFTGIVLFPLSVAYARRIWKRAPAVLPSVPGDVTARISRIEQTVEATAVEVERIGEGQRFITRLLSEREGQQALAQPEAKIASLSAVSSVKRGKESV